MNTLIICKSIHHGNTRKVAEVIAAELGAAIKEPSAVSIEEINKYELFGFGSGIYDDMHHLSVLGLADRLTDGNGKKVFIFSTSGVPVAILGDKFLQNYKTKAHAALRSRLEAKGYRVLSDLILPGYNTNVFLKYFGGLNKNRPNETDFAKAKAFTANIKTGYQTAA